MSESNVYFSEYYEIDHSTIEEAGFLDVSLVCDNPAFVDPFLLFANPKYAELHQFIVGYLQFLRDEAVRSKELDDGQFKHYYKFPEVKQAWLGYSVDGNAGLGLGRDFAYSLYNNLHTIFKNFGDEKITESAHIEKLCLVKEGVGIDKISDFTLNLIKSYLLTETQKFATKYLDEKHLQEFAIDRTYFNPKTKFWEGAKYTLPSHTSNSKVDYILLVPTDILTKEDTWISKNDFLKNNQAIFSAIPNDELREKVNRVFLDNLLTKLDKKNRPVKDKSQRSRSRAFKATVLKYPVLLDYYIKQKEEACGGGEAMKNHIVDTESINFYDNRKIIKKECKKKHCGPVKSHEDCVARIRFFKKTMESNPKALQVKAGIRLQEKQLQLMFKMTTHGSLFDYNSEVNNGRGQIDFIISMGSEDKTGLELKLASNKKLKQNLMNQTDVYKQDSHLKKVIKVIFFFCDKELQRVQKILEECGLHVDNESLFLIDCRKKESASNVKTQ